MAEAINNNFQILEEEEFLSFCSGHNVTNIDDMYFEIQSALLTFSSSFSHS